MNRRAYNKTVVANLFVEAALNAGKTVLVVTPEITVIKKRKGNLTLIEKYERTRRDNDFTIN